MPSIRIIVAFATLVIAITPARAQEWPTRPVTMVVPFAAGGPLDVVGRLLASRLSQILDRQVAWISILRISFLRRSVTSEISET